MAINASNPTTVNATYNLWAIANFDCAGSNLAPFGTSNVQPCGARATLVKYRVRSDGVSEQSPLPGDVITLSIPDLYALAQTNSAVATALSALVAAVQSVAQADGLL